ncbi:hypothetical protein [Luteolibacter luteus]|uniref:Uncharacterized protein n=1 Tax=Luteolibacter luteus TaxID=2728835 RepID=A0A858RNP9_9BACT|nr:hypothetical protein [Luteolibacter luteus]QJE99056.1 hypothetical protein HHL09_25850 [Luteolibacter luteus]
MKRSPEILRLRAATLLASALLLLAPPLAQAQGDTALPRITGQGMDGSGHFVIDSKVPAGSRHAVLEAVFPTQTGMTWRTMIATDLDGRQATVQFRLPTNGLPKVMARVRTGESLTVPVAELDESFCTVRYPLSEIQRIDFLAAASLKWNDWKDLPRDASFAQLIAWLKQQPGVLDAWVSEGKTGIFIELEDGDTLTLFTKPKPTAADYEHDFPGGVGLPTAPPIPQEIQRSFGSRAAPVKGLPESNRAICANFLEPYFPNSAPTIAGWLNGKGYKADVKQMSTVKEVKAWFDDGPLGFLFLHAHGFDYPTKKDGKQVAISLNQPAYLVAEDMEYVQMRDNFELKLGSELGSGKPVYGITRVFIKNHMKFAPHSLVMADTCYAGTKDLFDAFEVAGAGGYISWHWESGPQSNTRFLQIVDRMLGLNLQAPVSTPGERPFSLPVVKSWMLDKGYDIDPSPTPAPTSLRYYISSKNAAHLLRPSIRSIEPENTVTTTQMRLKGDFGKDPGANGKVTWGDREVHVSSWNQETGILIDGLSKPLPVGDFKVEVDNKYVSNLTPMTEWTIPFTYKVLGQGSLEYTIKSDFKVRFDVHGYRDKPEDPVSYGLSPFLNFGDLSGTATASGSYFEPAGGSTPGGTTYTWSGNRTLVSYDQGGNGAPENFLMGSALLDTATGVPQFFMITASSFRDEAANGHGYKVSIGYDPLTSAMLPLRFNPWDGWKLQGNSVPGMPPLDPRTVSSNMSWPEVTPAAVPTDETVR